MNSWNEGQSPIQTLRFCFPSDRHEEESAQIQSDICSNLQRTGWSPDDYEGPVRTTLVESIINAAKHGNKFDPQKLIFVTAQIASQGIRITVEDQGVGFDPSDVPDPTEPENLTKESGRGLLMMRGFMNHVEFNEAGNQVTMVKFRPTSAEEPTPGNTATVTA